MKLLPLAISFGITEIISLFIAIAIFIGFCFLIYTFFGKKPFKDNIVYNIIIMIVSYSLLKGVIYFYKIATTPSQEELAQKAIDKKQIFEKELKSISELTTKNLFLNNTSTYDKNEIQKIKTSTLYDNNFKLYWRSYFIYFLEDLDSSLITKSKYFGQKRNSIESKMLDNIVTQDDLDIINKIHNDFVYEHKVIIQNKIYTDKEYIDSLISWHLYKNNDKDYGLNIFKE
jgi:hypothetical protein